ncbi:MAG: hypothetical protein AAFP78_06910 [Pseudomonadota bacterium]
MIECTDAISCAVAWVPRILETAFALIAAASAVAALTPTPRDDEWIASAYRLVDMLALNIGYAKQTPPKPGGRFTP